MLLVLTSANDVFVYAVNGTRLLFELIFTTGLKRV